MFGEVIGLVIVCYHLGALQLIVLWKRDYCDALMLSLCMLCLNSTSY